MWNHKATKCYTQSYAIRHRSAQMCDWHERINLSALQAPDCHSHLGQRAPSWGGCRRRPFTRVALRKLWSVCDIVLMTAYFFIIQTSPSFLEKFQSWFNVWNKSPSCLQVGRTPGLRGRFLGSTHVTPLNLEKLIPLPAPYLTHVLCGKDLSYQVVI